MTDTMNETDVEMAVFGFGKHAKQVVASGPALTRTDVLNMAYIKLTGVLTRDPEIRFLPDSGRAVCNPSIAVNIRRQNEATEEWEDAITRFINLTVWGDDAEEFVCLLYTSPSPRDQRGSRMPSSA